MRGKSRDNVDEPDLPSRRVVRECLTSYLPTREPKLIVDVIPGFFERIRSGRTRTEVNEPLNVSQSFLTGKLFPKLGLRRLRRLGKKS